MEFHQLQRIQRQSGAQIDFTLIPSRQELRQNRMLRTIEKVASRKIVPEGVDMVQKLEESMELSEVAYKLASMLLKNENETGPDTIGLDAEELKELRAKVKANRKKKFPRKRSGNGKGGKNENNNNGRRRRDFSKSKPRKRK
jgi:ATP-dependent RNA helicase DeaD